MLFGQVWIARRANRSNLAKPQTFPLEKLRGEIVVNISDTQVFESRGFSNVKV